MPALDLPQARQTGPHTESPALPTIVLPDFVGNRRARADNRHVSAEDVDELRKFVEAVAPHERTEPGDAWIDGALEHRTRGFVQMCNVGQALLCVGLHRA